MRCTLQKYHEGKVLLKKIENGILIRSDNFANSFNFSLRLKLFYFLMKPLYACSVFNVYRKTER
jgi:hypothetical protein